MTKQGPGPRVLLVEDDDDSREALELYLAAEGYEVASVATAEAALDALEAGPYDLVLTDFNLPGGTGGWLLDEAAARGVRGDAAAILMSGTPDARASADLTLRKPLDLDRLLVAVHDLTGGRARAAGACEGPIVLTLYVTPGSVACARARRNVERAVAALDGGRVVLTVLDVTSEPERAAADRVDFTPLLLKSHPAPEVRLLGDLRETHFLDELLATSGAEPT